MEFRCLRREERESWFDLTGNVFVDTGRAYFVRHMRNDPWPVLESVFVAVDGKRLVATVRVFHRKVYLAGKAVRMGGIGEVSTLPEYRNKGLSTRLLEMGIAYMEKNGFDISMLFTGVNAHYAKLGWQDVPCEGVTAHMAPVRGDLLIRQARMGEDLAAIRGIYDLCAPQFDGAIVRDSLAYWKRWVASEARGNTLGAWHEDKLLGYVSYKKEEERVEVTDCGYLPGEASAFEALCEAAQRREGCRSTSFPRMLNPQIKGEVKKQNDWMARLIRPIELDRTIESTQELVKAFRKPVFFGVDGF